MTPIAMLLMVSLARPQTAVAITPEPPVPNAPNGRSLWAAPTRSLCPPLDTLGCEILGEQADSDRRCGYHGGVRGIATQR